MRDGNTTPIWRCYERREKDKCMKKSRRREERRSRGESIILVIVITVVSALRGQGMCL